MSNTERPVNMVLLFASEDEVWRVALLNHLSGLVNEGRITLWDISQIAAGTNRATAIEQHLKSASVILLLVSAACLASHDHEIEQALHRQKSGNVLLVPVLLHPVDWQNTRLSHLQPLPGNGKPVTMWSNQEAAFVEVIAGIRKALPEVESLATSAPAPTWPSIWNIPYPRNPFFTGRDELLTRLAEALKAGQATALSQAQAISGLGGIGKTQIAIEFAYQHRNKYEAVLWVLSDSRESLVSGYIALAGLLDLPQKDEQDQGVIIKVVKNWLQTHGSWLLILDNADDLEMAREFIPSIFSGHLLLTTRAWTMGKLAKRLEVETMTADTGALLLLRRVSLVEQDASLDSASGSHVKTAREICEELGGLPLALDQAGAFIEEVQCSLQDYQKRYQKRRAVLLQRRGGGVTDHPDSVATTWSLSFEKVEKKSAVAADLLRVCAFLHPDAIAVEIITKGAGHLGPLLGNVSENDVTLDDAIATLSAYSLVRRNASDRTLSIHRLVQAVLKDAMDEQTRKLWAKRAVLAVNEVFPKVEFATWPQCERYLPHALVCVEWIEQEQIGSLEAAWLLHKAGRYLCDHSRYVETELLYKRALSIRKQQLGEMHLQTAMSLNSLAFVYWRQGKYAEAEPLYEQGLAIEEQQLGEAHPRTATTLDNLAKLYHAQEKYREAESLYIRALAIKEQQLGPDHPETALSLGNLAVLYQRQGRHTEAESLLKRALAINEEQLGPEHPWTAHALRELARLYQDQRKYGKAEPLFRQAFTIYVHVLGETNPWTQNTQRHYVSLLRKTGRDEEATALETTGQLPSEEH